MRACPISWASNALPHLAEWALATALISRADLSLLPAR